MFDCDSALTVLCSYSTVVIPLVSTSSRFLGSIQSVVRCSTSKRQARRIELDIKNDLSSKFHNYSGDREDSANVVDITSTNTKLRTEIDVLICNYRSALCSEQA